MTLSECLDTHRVAYKHMKWEIPGTYVVNKANFSAGYYSDFKPDDRAHRIWYNTSFYWGYGYPDADPLKSIARGTGEDNWFQSKELAQKQHEH